MRLAVVALFCSGCVVIIGDPRENTEGADLAGTNSDLYNNSDLAGADLSVGDLAPPDMTSVVDLTGVDLTGADLAQPLDLSLPLDLTPPPDLPPPPDLRPPLDFSGVDLARPDLAAPCGNSGQACCGGSTCNSGALVCLGTCQSCGNNTQPCCSGGTCTSGSGLLCQYGECQPPCGNPGQVCCVGGPPCFGGAQCSPSGGGPNTCQCGNNTQPCCSGGTCTSGSGLLCQYGECQPPCGNPGQVCCVGGPPCFGRAQCYPSGGGPNTCQVGDMAMPDDLATPPPNDLATPPPNDLGGVGLGLD